MLAKVTFFRCWEDDDIRHFQLSHELEFRCGHRTAIVLLRCSGLPSGANLNLLLKFNGMIIIQSLLASSAGGEKNKQQQQSI